MREVKSQIHNETSSAVKVEYVSLCLWLMK